MYPFPPPFHICCFFVDGLHTVVKCRWIHFRFLKAHWLLKCFLRYIFSLTENLENIRVTRRTEPCLSSLFTCYLPFDEIHFIWRQKSFLSFDRIFFVVILWTPTWIWIEGPKRWRHMSPKSFSVISWSRVGYQLISGGVSADRGCGISWSRVGYQLITGGVSADRGCGYQLFERVGGQLFRSGISTVRGSTVRGWAFLVLEEGYQLWGQL